jgi:hypothetical protein
MHPLYGCVSTSVIEVYANLFYSLIYSFNAIFDVSFGCEIGQFALSVESVYNQY